MNLEEYRALDARALAVLVGRNEITSTELICLARAAHEKINPQINAVVEFYADAEQQSGPSDGPFTGVPFLRKDIGATEAGRLQECGSRLLAGNVAEVDSYYTRRARASGLQYVGRSAVPELAFSGFTESLLNGITRNPWAFDCSAGGSSGGAAAAVAAGIVPIAHASDGGGSIRIPASWCGLVGLNPSRGRVSSGPDGQDGLFGLAREFVVCRSVRDMAYALDVFAGPEAGDPFVIPPPDRPYAEELRRASGPLRIGVARYAWGAVPIAPDVLEVLDQTVGVLQAMGHQIEEIVAPVTPDDIASGVIGAFSLGLAKLPGLAARIGRPLDATTLEPVMLKLLDRVLGMSPADFMAFFDVLRRIRHEVGVKTACYDLLLTPTTPVTAPPHGLYATTREDLSAADFATCDTQILTFLGVFNVTGQPSVSLPLGQSADGMPIGIQLVARFAQEAELVRIAARLEEAMPWAGRRPPL